MGRLKNCAFLYGLAFVGTLSGCVGRSAPETIGSAFMHEDRALTLRLWAEEGGALGEYSLYVTPDDERYDGYMEHIGDIQPGEEVLVRPFPSESD